MMNYKYLRTLLLAIVYMFGVFGILASGGGGSSSSDDDDAGTAGGKNATLNGTAAKGIVIMGNVAADELDVNGAILRRVGDAVTGADGSYNLTLNNAYEGGPILITVTNGPDTTIVCDASSGCGTRTDGLPDNIPNGLIDFGEEYKPSSLSMKALVPDAQAGETIDTQVTPFTHMAADRALAGPVNSMSVNEANSEVSDLLGGVDILRAEPVDITDPASFADADAIDVIYAALAAAILEIADDDLINGQPDIDAVLATLSAQFAAGTFAAADMQEILDDAVLALAQVGAMDTSGLITAIQADVDDAVANSGGMMDPEPNPNAGDTDVELAKAFISDLRTWGTVIGNELDAPSDAFETQLNMAAEVSDFIFHTAAEDAISAGVDCIDALFDGIPGADVLTNCVTEYGTFTAGTISQAPTPNGIEYTIANATFSNLALDVASLNMVLVAPPDLTTVSAIVFGVQSIVAEGDVARWVVDSGTVTLNLATPYFLDYDADPAPNPEVESVSLDFDLVATQKQTVVNNTLVDATDPVTVSANFSTTIYTLSDGNDEILDGVPGSFALGGTISNSTGDSFEASLSVSIPTAAVDATMPLGPVLDLGSTYDDNNDPLNTGDHLIYWQYGINTFNYVNPDESYSITFNPGDGSVYVIIDSIYLGYSEGPAPGGPYATFNDYLIVALPLFMPNDFVGAIWIDGQGEYERSGFGPYNYAVDGFVEFTLSEADVEFYDDANPANGSVGLQFTAQFAGLPAADISITANATGFEAGDAMVIISYGLRQLVFDATSGMIPDTGSVEITNQDGVVMLVEFDNLDDDASINDITINNRVIATVQDVGFGTKITYLDGTFEIF